jgi:hypothetical protein
MLVHVVTKKGKGYAPAEAPPTNITAWSSSTSSPASRPRAGRAPSYTKRVRQGADRRGRARDEKIVAITAAMPSGTGLDKFAERFPERTFDVGIAEQHAVTFAAGLAAQGIGRSARSIRPSCSAPTTRSSTTSRSRICRCASRWTAPGWSAPTARPMPAASTSPISAPAQFRGDGRGRRGRAGAHGPHHGAASTAGPIAVRYPRGEGVGVALPESRSRSRSARAASSARARRSRSCRSARGSPKRRRPPTSSRPRAVDHGRRPALRQAARRGADPQAADHARGRGDGRGSVDRRARRACADAGQRRGADRRRASSSAPCACPTASRTRTSPRSNMTRRASTRRTSSRRC